jgi:uncharacterized repeat protein (TIGR01451 family)
MHWGRFFFGSSSMSSRQPNDRSPAEQIARPRDGQADIGLLWSARNRSFLVARSLTSLLALLFFMTAAHAAEQNQTPSGTTSNFLASPLNVGVSITSTGSGQTLATAALAGTGATYSPAIDVNATTFNFTSTVTSLTVGAMPQIGTVTFTFSRPVTNPRFHFARIGGATGTDLTDRSYFQTVWDLTTSGATVTPISGAMTTADSPAAGLDALRIQPSNAHADVACVPRTGYDPGGCGTVQINGTFSALTFNAFLWYRDRDAAAPATRATGDAYGVSITLNEDFGDAPASYGAAPHVVDNVQLGGVTTPLAGVHPSEADATTTVYTAYPATSPVSNATATGDVTDNALTLPLSPVGVGTYTLTVPVSARTGSAAGAQVCGWIDFNRNGAFTDGAPEEACAVAGASSATLSWPIPTGATYVAGESYLRLRIGTSADSAQVGSPTAPAATGEAEDYQVTLLPRVRLTKVLSPTTDTGVFNLSVAPNVAAAVGPGTPSVNNVGHNGTTGFVPVPFNTAITVQETAGTGTTLADYASVLSCLDRAGASVATGTTSAGFTSMTSAPAAAPTVPATAANSDASEISCTVTNTRQTTLTLVKQVVNDHGGTRTIADFPLTATGPTTITGVSGTAAVTSRVVSPGAYVLSETTRNFYTASTWSCVGGSLSGSTVTLASGQSATCTITNNDNPPVLRAQKRLPAGRAAAGDQFTLTIAGTNGPATVTTTGGGNVATGVATLSNAVAGTSYTISEAAAGTILDGYTTSYACTNASSVPGAQTPSGPGTSITITPAVGDDLTCTFDNARKPVADMRVTKTSNESSVLAGGTAVFSIVVTNGGPDAVTGAVVTDPPSGRTNLICTAPPTCAGAACPAGPLTMAGLDSGYTLGLMANGASVTFTVTCQVAP